MNKFFPYLLIILFTSMLYYKFFLFGKIPFPGDLLVSSYSPWFDYYKLPVQNPLISDVFSQFFLWKYLAIDSLKNLQLPLWNPYSFTGTPLLATYHSAVLYPLNIFLFLPKYFGWGFYIYSQTLIASLTFYLFLSQIIKSKFAKAIGTIIFSLGGLMTTWLELGTAVHAMAWLPLSLYAVKKYSETPKFRFLLILIAAIFMTVLAGNAQITTYSYLIIVLYLLFLNWKKKASIRKIFLLFFSILISIPLLSFQLLPSMDLLQNSIRQTESYAAQSNFGLLNIKDSFKFFIADYFGNPTTGNYWGNLNYSETSPFLGMLTIPLLIYSFLKVRKGDSSFFSILLILSLILVFDNPISSFIYHSKIPLLTSSYASRMLFITLIGVSTLCAFAIDHIMENKNLRGFLIITLYSWAVVVGIIIGTLFAHFFVWDILGWAPSEKYLKFYLEDKDYNLKNFIVSLRNTIVPFAIISSCLIVSVVLNIVKKGLFIKNKLNILFALILFLSALDLGRYFLKFNPFVGKNLIFPKVPALEFLQKQPGLFRVGREHAEVFPPNTWIAYNLYSYEGYDPIYLNNYGRFMHFLNGGDIRKGNSTRYAELGSNYISPFLDAANTKYFIAILRDNNGYIPGDLLNFKVKETNYNLVFKDKSAAILENPKSLERAYLAPSILKTTKSGVEDLIMEKESFDPSRTIALDEDLNINSVTGKGDVKISYYSPNQVKINTDTSSDEILVLADQYDEGWKAKIDGSDTKISRANLIFRAVKIPPGRHLTVFYYWPKSFDLGMKISLISFAFLSLFTFWSVKKKLF